MKKAKTDNAIHKIWTFFASVKLAIIIFAFIAAVSIIGTIVEQQAEPDKNMALLTGFFGDSLAPDVYNIFAQIGFMDMYRSWWYIAMLVILALNIVVCSFDRLPGILKIIKDPVAPLSSKQIEKLIIKRSLIVKGQADGVKNIVRHALRTAGFNTDEYVDDGCYQLCSRKGAWRRLGVYVIHLSILLVMFGALISLFFSMESYISLPEGDISSVTYPVPGSGGTAPIPLGFDIRNDGFEVEFYGDTETAKSYKSDVTIFEKGEEVFKKTIRVNDPLTYKGSTFYLNDYGVMEKRLNRGTFIFRVTTKDGLSSDVRLHPGNKLHIPATSIVGKIINFSPALIHDKDGNLTTYTEKLHNPAVQISFTRSGDELYTSWIFKRFPETSRLPDGNRVEFVDYWGPEYAFFRIRKDPGIWLIYAGLIMMGIGFLNTFFMNSGKIWVCIKEEEINSKVVIGAAAYKSRHAFEKKIDSIITGITKSSPEV